MEPHEALHTEARRYLQRRHFKWTTAYTELSRSSRTAVNRVHTDEEYAIFPRYLVAEAILDEVQNFVPTDFSDLDGARARLVECAMAVEIDWKREVATRVSEDERDEFVHFVKSVGEVSLRDVAPLPYVRTLRREEISCRFKTLVDKWGVGAGGSNTAAWYPDMSLRIPAGIEVYNYAGLSDVFVDMDVFCGAVEVLMNGTHFFELPETDERTGHEREAFDPPWGHGGTFFTDEDSTWVLYENLDATVVIAGPKLVATLHERWPDWSSHAVRFGKPAKNAANPIELPARIEPHHDEG